jgi:putative FmdB family regulatory protein
MPTYSYCCNNCNKNFELFFYIKDYCEKPKCCFCQSNKTNRNYILDVTTQSASVKKSDSELKTIGDLAQRNTERMSEDQKTELYIKHNSYKEHTGESKPLPTGMKRITRPPKIKWPGTSDIKKRRDIKR